MTDPVEGDAVLAAVLTVFSTNGAADAAENTAEAIAGQITATAPSNGGGTRPAGRDGRSRRGPRRPSARCRPDAARRPRPRVRGDADADPVPDRGGVVDVVLTSPQTQLTEPMLDLFAAISDTFAGTRPSTSGAENGAVTNPEGQ